ncbi:extracellular metallo proteinase MEP [Pleomassaria siparia CBS 279.74]|uniref:Extracellular metalloproteinase n=1 Tax=Pleomassaria siparia CBS 279.74 TaxID=1314801 RepID=A0A6G1KHC1_9PLEO|nr:extracellular metallo proteinase MEP [Pleomassaria siparia CBS 279.74]
MRSSLLIAAVASLALPSVFAHPHESFGKRTIAANKLFFSTNGVASEYHGSTEIGKNEKLKALVKRADPRDTAFQLVRTQAPGAAFRLTDDPYLGNNSVTFFHFQQTVNGIDVDNAQFNVNIGKDGQIFSYGNSFYKGELPSASKLRKRSSHFDALAAFKAAVDYLDLEITCDKADVEATEHEHTYRITGAQGVQDDPEAELVYIQTWNGRLSLAWRVETNLQNHPSWLLTYVDANNIKKIHAVADYVSQAITPKPTYQVLSVSLRSSHSFGSNDSSPWGNSDPSEGPRVLITNPVLASSSEFGWHANGTEQWHTTVGNNVWAQYDRNGSTDMSKLADAERPYPTNNDMKFEFPLDLNAKYPSEWIDAAVTQVFYTANMFHDLLYLLGFDEKAGNFEFNDNNAGGIGGDFVVAHIQVDEASDNAFFLTPPDGTNGVMTMGLWTNNGVVRDSSFDNSIVIHELTHGLSNRLTGGLKNGKCLNTVESAGMGEGWGDFFAQAIRLKPGDTRDTDYAMGEWAANDPAGIRSHLYSTNMETNPLVYTDVDKAAKQEHTIGTVWASILYEVLWNLIDKHGKNDNSFPDISQGCIPSDGRFLAMNLVMDGMAIQPCNPNFVSARTAIIDADKALTGGENACELWKAFAKRGLGKGAIFDSDGRTNSFLVPDDVC